MKNDNERVTSGQQKNNETDRAWKFYAFRPAIERLRELKDLSPKVKLDWLEEANQLVAALVHPEKLDRWWEISPAQQDSLGHSLLPGVNA